MVSFAVQKILSLIMSHLFTLAFISFALRDISEKITVITYVKEGFAFFAYSSGFMVSG